MGFDGADIRARNDERRRASISYNSEELLRLYRTINVNLPQVVSQLKAGVPPVSWNIPIQLRKAVDEFNTLIDGFSENSDGLEELLSKTTSQVKYNEGYLNPRLIAGAMKEAEIIGLKTKPTNLAIVKSLVGHYINLPDNKNKYK